MEHRTLVSIVACGLWLGVVLAAGCGTSTKPTGGQGQSCTAEGTCDQGLYCDLDTATCYLLEQDCVGRECGPSPTAGHDCGSCPGAAGICTDQGRCIDDCAGRQCGPSQRQGLDCGSCPGAKDWCTPEGQCEDDCADRECGPSLNAGLDCGTCASAQQNCIGAGQCVALGIEWIGIPGGSFMMGSNDGEAHETPVHEVSVPPLEMMKTEVTVAMYTLCVEDGGACSEPDTGPDSNWTVVGREAHPVNFVSWHQAIDFCRWLGSRLPSEAEWEYCASSAGLGTIYPWGNAEPDCNLAVFEDCGHASTEPACSRQAGNTALGLCDMAGNVWEWAQDAYHEGYASAPTDGSAWEVPSHVSRIQRGSSWSYTPPGGLRSAYRHFNGADTRYQGVGFRCARSLE